MEENFISLFQFLICIKQLYFSLPPAFSEIDDILGKLLELLSAASSKEHPVLSIFISSTMNDRNVAQDTLLFWISWKHWLPMANSVKLSISKTVQATAPTCTVVHDIKMGAKSIGEMYC